MGIVDMIMVGILGVNSIAAVGFGEMIVFLFIGITNIVWQRLRRARIFRIKTRVI